MGSNPQLDDEIVPLHSYVKKAVEAKGQNQPILTTIPLGCSACSANHYQVTNLCKGCLARPCVTNCPKDAVKIEGGKAVINNDACINCGKCQQLCPFNAITLVSVPCEEACPVGAIIKNEFGEAEIIQDKCIECGACSRACPFGAITECSQIIETADKLISSNHVTAIIAPAIEGQFPGTLTQIISSLHALGFNEVIEAAQGALSTAENESQEIRELKEGSFLTSSCCPAYTACVKKHIPSLSRIAKKREGLNDPYVDAVITFEELAAFLIAWDVDVHEQKGDDTIQYLSVRQFAVSGGVTKSLEAMLQPGKFIEVMSCEEGCIGGPACISDPRLVKKRASYITA